MNSNVQIYFVTCEPSRFNLLINFVTKFYNTIFLNEFNISKINYLVYLNIQ